MIQTGNSIEAMTWWAYVQRHAGQEPNARIADRVGVTPSTVGRWGKGSTPDPKPAAAFAKAYGRPVLEAFIAAGFLTPEEAGERPSAAPTLTALTDAAILDEVERRMKEGRTWDAGSTGPEEDDGVVTTRPEATLAARNPRRGTPSKHQPDSQAMAGEESQDNGTDDPA